MVILKEFLPNPIGPDKEGEYIALFNNGDKAVDLSGWSLKDLSGKSFSLGGYKIKAQSELKLFSPQTKISLNNQNETIYLINPGGQVEDELGFAGIATEGRLIFKAIDLSPEVKDKLFDDLIGKYQPVGSVGLFNQSFFLNLFLTALSLAVFGVFVYKKLGLIENHNPNNTKLSE